MRRTIYLLRHGETLWNREGRMQGQLDSPLSPRGEDQVRRVGEALRGHVDGDFSMTSSPLGRVRQTAEIVCDALDRDPASCTTDDRLMEITWGSWDGLTRDEIEARDPGALERRARDRWGYVPPGGESYRMLAGRIRGWLDDLPADCRLVVVAHGAVGRVLRGLYAGLPRQEMLALDEPQDAFFRLRGGGFDRISAAHDVAES